MLYIMRHGKTDWNAKHKLQGRTDIPLNEEGIQMAEQAKEKYKDVNFDICYCSPLVSQSRQPKLFWKEETFLLYMTTGLWKCVLACMKV